MNFDFTGWTLVFDLDGTLVETAPDLHAALNHTLASKALGPVTLESIRMMIGDGAKALIRKGLRHHNHPIDEDEIETTLWPLFLEHYLQNITRLSAPFPNCIETLSALKAAGATLAVCTNKAQHLAEEVLRGLKLDHFFAATVGGDIAISKKPDGAHILEAVQKAGGQITHAIMIGDAHTDERAARHAELPLVFVNFGYGVYSHEPYDPVRLIDHWQDMQQALIELAIVP